MENETQAATEALAAALPAEPDQPTAQPEATPAEAPEAPEAPELPASKEVDLSHLPEEAQIFIRAREREMQADATRKWQEAAELRKQAEQAIQFVEALNSDPNFALQVQEHLENQLAQAGFLGNDDPDIFAEDYGSGTDPYQAEIAELQQWKAQVEEAMQVQRQAAELDRQIAQIQAQNPSWTRDDFEVIVDLGFATDGDLFKAAEAYRAIQDRALAGYLERKGSVTAPPVVPTTEGAPAPSPMATDEELRQAALERIRAELG